MPKNTETALPYLKKYLFNKATRDISGESTLNLFTAEILIYSTKPVWSEKAGSKRRGRPLHYTDTGTTTAVMLKSVFYLNLLALQRFIDSFFQMMDVPLCCADFVNISKRSQSVNVNIKTPTRGKIAYLVIDFTWLKMLGEGKRKVKKHGAAKWRKWRKLHLAIHAATHEIVCADLLLRNVTDAQALPGLMSQTDRQINKTLADGVYDVRDSKYSLEKKEFKPVITLLSSAKYCLLSRYLEQN